MKQLFQGKARILHNQKVGPGYFRRGLAFPELARIARPGQFVMLLKAVSDVAATHHVRCQISLETTMACGFGVCLGYAVEKAGSTGAYFHSCTDGPVFDSRAIVIEAS